MRPLLFWVRSCFIGLIVVGLVVLPAEASVTPCVGVIVSCNNALLSGVDAMQGVNVYPGDALETSDSGALRLAVGSSQVDLVGPTLINMSEHSGTARADVQQGTIDFSAAPGQLEIGTPLGVVRGDGTGRASGRVIVLGANQIAVYAFGGTLNFFTDDGTRTIAAGTAYRFVAEPTDDGGAPQETSPTPVRQHHRKRKIAAFIIVGGVALAAFAIWNALTVSPTTLSPAAP